MKKIVYHPPALKSLSRMPGKTANRIRSKISAFCENPESQTNNVKALKGEIGIRLRVGEWRVVMVNGEVLDVLRIGPRGSIYKG